MAFISAQVTDNEDDLMDNKEKTGKTLGPAAAVSWCHNGGSVDPASAVPASQSEPRQVPQRHKYFALLS